MTALTPARVTRLAKQAAPELRWSSERGARGILVRVWDAADEGIRSELRLLNAARDLINATDLAATVVGVRANRRTGRPQFRVLVTSPAQEAAAMQEQADKRAAALDAALAEVVARRVAEVEAVAEAAEPEEDDTCPNCGQIVSPVGSLTLRADGRVEHGWDCATEPVKTRNEVERERQEREEAQPFVGEIEPPCPSCRYTSGHTSWCREQDGGPLAGEIRQDEHGARYWTAEEIRALREQEAAQRAEVDHSRCLCPTCLASREGQCRNPRPEDARTDRCRECRRICGPSRPGNAAGADTTPAVLCTDWCRCSTLTVADVLAMSTGHPAGSRRRQHDDH